MVLAGLVAAYVVSGAQTFNLIELAKDTDYLVHEAEYSLDNAFFSNRFPPDYLVNSHTSAEQVGEVAAAAGAKPMLMAVPEGGRCGQQARTQMGLVEAWETVMATTAEQCEQIVVIERRQGGELEVEQCVLARIEIDAVDLGRIVEQIVERVAAGAGDHRDTTAGADTEQGAVGARVLPTGVVDQPRTMHVAEPGVVDAMLQSRHIVPFRLADSHAPVREMRARAEGARRFR